MLEIRNTNTSNIWVAYGNSHLSWTHELLQRYIFWIKMYLWWNLCTLYLHACQVRVIFWVRMYLWWSLCTLCLHVCQGAGIAQWLEHRTRDWKVAGSNPCWNGGRIFFSRVDFLCCLLFRYPFHPRVTAVARKKSRSFCQKVQVAGYS